MLFGLPQITFFVLVGAIVVLLAWIIRLEWRLRQLFGGRGARSLEEVVVGLVKAVKHTDQINLEIRNHLVKMESRLRRSIQHVKTVRFNPFRGEGQGSNQSFAAAFLDEHGDGVVISTLYARDKVGVYAKPIAGRASTFELTEEETAVLS